MAAICRLLCTSCYYLVECGIYRRSYLLLRRRIYSSVIKTYNYDLLLSVSVCFNQQFSFFRSVLQNILAQKTSMGRRVLHWIDVMLNFQQKSTFAHLSAGLPLLTFVRSIVGETTHNSDNQRRNRVVDHFRLQYLCVRNQCKGRNLFCFSPGSDLEAH